MPADFRLTFNAPVGMAHVPFLRRHLRAARQMIRTSLAEMSVALVGDRVMAQLHERFMNLAGPTDVLTFPLELDRTGKVTSGEVIVCVPEARRRAKEHRNSVENEVLLYAVHGMLHLCGLDDRTARGFRNMHRTEDAILTRLGIGPVFAPVNERATGDTKRVAGRSRGSR